MKGKSIKNFLSLYYNFSVQFGTEGIVAWNIFRLGFANNLEHYAMI